MLLDPIKHMLRVFCTASKILDTKVFRSGVQTKVQIGREEH